MGWSETKPGASYEVKPEVLSPTQFSQIMNPIRLSKRLRNVAYNQLRNVADLTVSYGVHYKACNSCGSHECRSTNSRNVSLTKLDQLVSSGNIVGSTVQVVGHHRLTDLQSFCSLVLACVDRSGSEVLNNVAWITKSFNSHLHGLQRLPGETKVGLTRSNYRVSNSWDGSSTQNINTCQSCSGANNCAGDDVLTLVAFDVSFDSLEIVHCKAFQIGG